MTEELYDLSRIERQIELPKKPTLGTISGWLLWLFFAVAAFLLYRCEPYNKALAFFCIAFFVIMLIVAVLLLLGIIKGYLILRKEYRLSQVDEQAYRHIKALEFVKQNEKNSADDELLVEFRKRHPKKKLPEFIKEAILWGDALTIQKYIEYEQEKGNE